MLSCPYHFLTKELNLSWEPWLESTNDGNKPIYKGKVSEFLKNTIPKVIENYTIDDISRLEFTVGTLDIVQQKNWSIHIEKNRYNK